MHPLFRHSVQVASLALFCLLLSGACAGLGLAPDSFLRLDPLAGVAVPLAAGAFVDTLCPVLLVYACTMLFGRVFCGWICPMGAILDLCGALVRPSLQQRQKKAAPPKRSLKYVLLCAILFAAGAFGINLAFWASPLPLTARLYALVVAPWALSEAECLLPAIEWLGGDGLRYWQPEIHTYTTQWFVVLFFGSCILLERVQPRFWCRFLCPAGALLGLFARIAPVRRRVDGKACLSCGHCSAHCPAKICQDMPEPVPVDECLVCHACVAICPQKALHFGLAKTFDQLGVSAPLQSRRAFCQVLVKGMALGSLLALSAQAGKSAEPLRPPGSIPEEDFLARCIRCAACMQACPTGGLQPIQWQAGLGALFSPNLTPRLGPCRPECNACGNACPSRAILALTPQEKLWAKVGTAVLNQSTCLAWAQDKRCMVCKENCPFGAIEVRVLAAHKVPVPSVQEQRCFGCGYCEKYCPTELSSIRVTAKSALRLHTPHFRTTAQLQGIELQLTGRENAHPPKALSSDRPPPGFLE